MPEPTLLSDVILPAWTSLTPEEQLCWHYWAAKNPTVTADGQLRTLYGEQAHYSTNAALAVTDSLPLLTEPPPDKTPPRQVAVLTMAWPLQAQLAGSTTARAGFVYLDLTDALPADTAVIVRQGYDRRRSGHGRPPRIRHVKIIFPLESGVIGLQTPNGYFASTAGVNRFSTIQGHTARRRPDKPLGTIRIVNVTNGQTIRQTLKNPYGGSRKKSNRKRATALAPPGPNNHYP